MCGMARADATAHMPVSRLVPTLLVLLVAGGCAAAPSAPAVAIPPPPPPVAAAEASAPVVAPPRAFEPEAPVDTSALVTLFVAGEGCSPLEPRNAKLADGSPVGAVKAIVHSKAFAHLALSEPELEIEQSTARVELKGSGPRWSVHMLPACEQVALLGAIRMTLQINERWGIRHVLFTEGGNLLAI